MTNINTFQGDVFIHEYIKHTGDDNNLFGFSGTDTFKIATAGTDRLTINSSGTVTIAGTLTAGGFSGNDISTGTVAAARVATLNQNTTGTAGSVTASVTPGSYLLGSAYNGSTARTFNVDASTTATANKIVARNGSNHIFALEVYAQYFVNDGSDNNTYFGFPSNDNFQILTSGSERFRILSNGNCGHRLSNPDCPLAIKQSNNGATGGIELLKSDANVGWQIATDAGQDLQFFYNGNGRGYLLDNGSQTRMNFTGQHRTFIEGIPFTNATNYEGLIVSADQNKYIKMSGGVETGSNAITINESLPIVSITKVEKDKKCFGVVSLSEDPETRQEQHGTFMSIIEKELGDTRVYMNSVGEGALWVINNNGSLESGDYITSSNVAGYGQKQDDDILHNYTVAKLTMDCDFNPSTQPIKKFRRELSNVNHYIKTTLLTVTEEEYLNITEEERTTETEIYYTNGEAEINITRYNTLDSDEKSDWTEGTRTIYKRIERKELAFQAENYDIEVRQELVNVLDEHGQFQLDNHPTETEKAYKIRYLDANGVITDEANAVHIAAFVGCTYHCG